MEDETTSAEVFWLNEGLVMVRVEVMSVRRVLTTTLLPSPQSQGKAILFFAVSPFAPRSRPVTSTTACHRSV